MDGGVKPANLHQHQLSNGSEHSFTSLDGSIGSGWSLDKIQRSMEQKADSFDNMLTPLEEDVEATPTDHVTSNHTPALKVVPVKAPKPPTLPKPKGVVPPAVSTKPPPHQRVPKTTSPPPDIVPTTNSGRHGYNNNHHKHSGHHSNSHHSNSSDEDDPTSIAINKKRPKVPDLTSMDPRKPTLKVKKVPRSVWQPRPMNKAIQSSSESDSEGSNYSANTVVGPGDSSTLRSAHV
jgi:hypothetical protein